jgi:hypothetical protein
MIVDHATPAAKSRLVNVRATAVGSGQRATTFDAPVALRVFPLKTQSG